MKTRNASVLSLKESNKNKNSPNIKKTAKLKSKNSTKNASYRDLHNIGRRKSTSTVVTYSLDSRLFFDVYAKFNNENLPKDRNVYNGLYEKSFPNKSESKSPESVSKPSKRQSKILSDRESTDEESEPIKKPAKILKVSLEAKPLNSDEECIPSPKLPAVSPIRSSKPIKKPVVVNRMVTTRTSKVVITEPVPTVKSPVQSSKNETFQRLLENKTVFKKHLSQNLNGNQRKSQIKSTESSPVDRRLSKRLNKSASEDESVPSELQPSSPDKTRSSKKSLIKAKTTDKPPDIAIMEETVSRKPVRKSKSSDKPPNIDLADESAIPKRGKRIASLNAAAIINCVQNLFHESPKRSPLKPVGKRRRRSSIDDHWSDNDDEDIAGRVLATEEKAGRKIRDRSQAEQQNTNKSPKKPESPTKSDDKSVKSTRDKSPKKTEEKILKKSDEKPIAKIEEKYPKKLEEKSPKKPEEKISKKSEEKSSRKPEEKSPKKPDEKLMKKSEEKLTKKPDENLSKKQEEKPFKKLEEKTIKKSDIKSLNKQKKSEEDKKKSEEKQIKSKMEEKIHNEEKIEGLEVNIKTSPNELLTTQRIQTARDNGPVNESLRQNGSVARNVTEPQESNQKRTNTATFFDITSKTGVKVKQTSVSNNRRTGGASVKTESNTVTDCDFVRSGKKVKNAGKIRRMALVQVVDQEEAESLWQWQGEPCRRQIQLQLAGEIGERTCYQAIRHSRDDVVIRSSDCVLLRSSPDQEPFLAKIVVFYLDEQTGKKMMTLLWYYRPEHTEQGRMAWHTDSDVYASRHLDNNSVDCIEDKAFVLPVELYSRFMAYQKRQSASTRPGLAARLMPVSNEDTVCSDPVDNKTNHNNSTADGSVDMFVSSLYYSINFQNSFPAEMTNSNVFVCRGLYDINQHKITRNVLHCITSPKRDHIESCESVDSAMSISSCDTHSDILPLPDTVERTPLSAIPIPSSPPLPPVPPSLSSSSPSPPNPPANHCLPPISSFQQLLPSANAPLNETAVPSPPITNSNSCPPPPASKPPIQPPLPPAPSTNNDMDTNGPPQPNGHLDGVCP